MKDSILMMLIATCLILANSNPVHAMYDESGKWVCFDATIEMSYYEFYTNEFQLMVDKVSKSEGPEAAKIFFEDAVISDEVGQDWKRSKDCLISLGVDGALLPGIVILDSERIDSIDDSFAKPEKITPDLPLLDMPRESEPDIKEEKPDNSDLIGIIGIIVIIIVVGVFAYLRFMKAKTSKEKNKLKRDFKVEIDIGGGIEK